MASNSIKLVDSGIASSRAAASGYYASYHTEAYTHVKLTYGDEWIKVRIVDMK